MAQDNSPVNKARDEVKKKVAAARINAIKKKGDEQVKKISSVKEEVHQLIVKYVDGSKTKSRRESASAKTRLEAIAKIKKRYRGKEIAAISEAHSRGQLSQAADSHDKIAGNLRSVAKRIEPGRIKAAARELGMGLGGRRSGIQKNKAERHDAENTRRQADQHERASNVARELKRRKDNPAVEPKKWTELGDVRPKSKLTWHRMDEEVKKNLKEAIVRSSARHAMSRRGINASGKGRSILSPKKGGPAKVSDHQQQKQFEKDSDKGWDEYDKHMREDQEKTCGLWGTKRAALIAKLRTPGETVNEAKKWRPGMSKKEMASLKVTAKAHAEKRKVARSTPKVSAPAPEAKKDAESGGSRLDWFNKQPELQRWLRVNVHTADRERVMNDIWNSPPGKAHDTATKYKSGELKYRKPPKPGP